VPFYSPSLFFSLPEHLASAPRVYISHSQLSPRSLSPSFSSQSQPHPSEISSSPCRECFSSNSKLLTDTSFLLTSHFPLIPSIGKYLGLVHLLLNCFPDQGKVHLPYTLQLQFPNKFHSSAFLLPLLPFSSLPRIEPFSHKRSIISWNFYIEACCPCLP